MVQGTKRVSVQKHFDNKAGSYYRHVYLSGKRNCHVHNQQIRRQFFRQLLPSGSAVARRALDVGCGPGSIAVVLGDLGYETFCIDLSFQMLVSARENIGTTNLFQCSADSLCFRDNSFDVITAAGVLEYVPDDEKTLREVLRVLKPGGTFIASVPIKSLVSEAVKGRLKRRASNRFHHKGYAPSSFVDAIRDVGFDVNETISHHFVFFPVDYLFPRLSIRLDSLLTRSLQGHRSFARLGKTLIVSATKPERRGSDVTNSIVSSEGRLATTNANVSA